MDRTDWQLGGRWHNLLVIGYLCQENIFIPLVWKDLGERKTSSAEERLELVDRLRAWWKATGLPMPPLILYADREFIGAEWWLGLLKRQMQFVIRVRENLRFALWKNGCISDKTYRVDVLMRYMRCCKIPYLEIVVDDHFILQLTLAQCQDEKGGIATLALVSNIDDPQNAGNYYSRRWGIEDCFGHCKSKGLNLEDFNLSAPHKLEIMSGLIFLTYALAVRMAIEQDHACQVKLKRYKNKFAPAVSTFKFGLKLLRRQIRNFKELLNYLVELMHFLLKYFQSTNYIDNNFTVQ